MESVPILESQRGFVNLDLSLATQFFLAHDWRSSPLRLHKAHAEGKRDEPAQDSETGFSVDTRAAKL
jgi:hypothetical protein